MYERLVTLAINALECLSLFPFVPLLFVPLHAFPPVFSTSEQTTIPELRFLLTFQVDGRTWVEWLEGRRRTLSGHTLAVN